MHRSLFNMVYTCAIGFYLASALYIVLQIWRFVPMTEVFVHAVVMNMVSASVLIATIFVRWKRRWPTPVTYLTIATGLAGIVSLLYSAWKMLSLFGEGNSFLLMKVLLPGLIALATGLACIALVLYLRDNRPQSNRWGRD